jgi:acyl dehydratase
LRVFADIDEFAAAAGTTLGQGAWRSVTQEQIQLFADATDDHQWIHTDPERAAAGPFGTTIAHGYLTLSMIPALGQEIYRIDGLAMGINYGLDRVRFPAPVPTGSRIRATADLHSVEVVPGGVQALVGYVIEIEGATKPACVAECVSRLIRAT